MSKLERLKNISFNELRTRAAQMLHQRAERLGVSSQAREPDDRRFARLFVDADDTRNGDASNSVIASPDDLFTAFYKRAPQAIDDDIESFAALLRPQETAAEVAARFSASVPETLKRADRIVAGSFDLLGYENLSFGASVDWHFEPVAGKRIEPNLHWSRINFLSADVAGDKKITWELNRHGYFLTLARAYLFTKDERYAATFAAHLKSWMDANPPKLGINWASSLEIAFRSIAWLWALRMFESSAHITPALVWRASKFIYLFASHLETYLSTYFSPNTHLTGEALGLYYIGTLLPQFKRAHVWRETGERILLAELERQVRPDGVYFEQTSYYQRYTADFYTHYVLLKRLRNERVAPEVETKLQALLDHLMFVQRPDGTSPRYGDDDGGKLIKLDDLALDDFRAALANGATLFAREDYKFATGALAEETVWLMGARTAQKFERLNARPPVETSRAFADGGYFAMRDSWRADSNYMLLDCGEHGSLSNGHAHADALSFEIAARGRTVFIDPGTYTYTGAPEMRDRFRGTAAHNTLTVDGESSSVPGAAFRWQRVAQSRVKQWLTNARFDFFRGAHDGFNRAPVNVPEHERTVLFLKDDYFIVLDRAASEEAHCYELHFHLALDVTAQLPQRNEQQNMVAEQNEGKMINVMSDSANVLTIAAFVNRDARDVSWQVAPDFVSPAYGSLQPAETLRLSCHAARGFETFTFMLPRAGEANAPRIVEVEADAGRAFEIALDQNATVNERDAMRDLLLVEAASHGTETAGENRAKFAGARELTSDAAWTWLRCDESVATTKLESVREMLLIEGSRVSLNSKVIFASEQQLDFACVRRVGDELVIEMSRSCAFQVERNGACVVRLNGEAFDVSSLDDDEILRFDRNGTLTNDKRLTLAATTV